MVNVGQQFCLSSIKNSTAAENSIGAKMKCSDKNSKWMWWFLAVGSLLQSYFVRELLAIFVLFALGSVAVAISVFCIYLGMIGSSRGITWSVASLKSMILAPRIGRVSNVSVRESYDCAHLEGRA